MNAIQALSQLSYSPTGVKAILHKAGGSVKARPVDLQRPAHAIQDHAQASTLKKS